MSCSPFSASVAPRTRTRLAIDCYLSPRYSTLVNRTCFLSPLALRHCFSAFPLFPEPHTRLEQSGTEDIPGESHPSVVPSCMVRPFTSSTQGSLHFASCEPIIKVAFAVRLRRQLRCATHESQPSEVQRPSLDLIDFF
jgi:hypothetical protein